MERYKKIVWMNIIPLFKQVIKNTRRDKLVIISKVLGLFDKYVLIT